MQAILCQASHELDSEMDICTQAVFWKRTYCMFFSEMYHEGIREVELGRRRS